MPFNSFGLFKSFFIAMVLKKLKLKMAEETQQTSITQNYHLLKSKNEKLRIQRNKLEEKKTELEDTLRKTNDQNQKMTQEFMKISNDIDKRNEELQEKFLNEKGSDTYDGYSHENIDRCVEIKEFQRL